MNTKIRKVKNQLCPICLRRFSGKGLEIQIDLYQSGVFPIICFDCVEKLTNILEEKK